MDSLMMSDNSGHAEAVSLIERGGEPEAQSDTAATPVEETSDDPVAQDDAPDDNRPADEDTALDDVDDAPAVPDTATSRKLANRFEGDTAVDELEKAYMALQPEYTRSRQELAEMRRSLDAAIARAQQLETERNGLPEETLARLAAESERTGVDVNTLLYMERRDQQFQQQVQQQTALESLTRYVAGHEVQSDPELRQAVFESIERHPELLNMPVWMSGPKQAELAQRQFDLLVAEAQFRRLRAELPAKEAALRKVVEAEQRERRAMRRSATPVSANRSTPPQPTSTVDPDVKMLLDARGEAHQLW